MTTPAPAIDPVAAIRGLTLSDIERRMADIDAERAALSSLRRAMVARERARRRHAGTAVQR